MSEGHFEAKKHAYRQTQDGIVVSFVIHPNDVDSAFAVAPLGTRYMVGFAEITDAPVVQPERTAALQAEAAGSIPARVTKRKFAEMPYSQQAALRCNDAEFKEFLADEFPIAWGMNGEAPVATVRHVCQVESRTEFDKSGSAALEWQKVEELYQDWLTTKRYAGIRK